MAEIKYNVCDRCGKKLEGKRFLAKLTKPIFKLHLRDRGIALFDYFDYNYELCRECGEAVRNFIRTNPMRALQAFECPNPTEKEGLE